MSTTACERGSGLLRFHTVGACCVAALALSPADPSGARNITAPLDNRNGTILEGTGAQCGAGSLLFYGAEGTDDVFEYASRRNLRVL